MLIYYSPAIYLIPLGKEDIKKAGHETCPQGIHSIVGMTEWQTSAQNAIWDMPSQKYIQS